MSLTAVVFEHFDFDPLVDCSNRVTASPFEIPKLSCRAMHNSRFFRRLSTAGGKHGSGVFFLHLASSCTACPTTPFAYALLGTRPSGPGVVDQRSISLLRLLYHQIDCGEAALGVGHAFLSTCRLGCFGKDGIRILFLLELLSFVFLCMIFPLNLKATLFNEDGDVVCKSVSWPN